MQTQNIAHLLGKNAKDYVFQVNLGFSFTFPVNDNLKQDT